MLKSKTFWAGIVGVIAAAEQYFTGAATLAEAMQIAFPCFIGIFLKHGQVKTNGS